MARPNNVGPGLKQNDFKAIARELERSERSYWAGADDRDEGAAQPLLLGPKIADAHGLADGTRDRA